MRVLITGITGMAGSHLADYILDKHPEVEIYGLCRWRSSLDNLDHLDKVGLLDTRNLGQASSVRGEEFAQIAAGKRVKLLRCEMLDPTAVSKVIKELAPDRIFHLAAQSFVPASWDAPGQTLETNIIGEVHLFEAIIAAGLSPRIHIAGSSEEYGLVYPEEAPVKESNPFRPLSPYGVSKVAQELLAWQYFRSFGLQTVVTRAFNHEGPRRGEVFVTSSFAKQIVTIEKERPADPVLKVGDLSAERDWTDVRDVVRGYWLALEKGTPGEAYNIGSGTVRTVSEMLDTLLAMSPVSVRVSQDPRRFRPSDVRLLVADASKFRQATGWAPVIPFKQTMGDLLDYWRERLGVAR